MSYEHFHDDLVYDHAYKKLVKRVMTPPLLHRNWHVILIEPSQSLEKIQTWLNENTKYAYTVEPIDFYNIFLSTNDDVPTHRVMFRSKRDAAMFMVFFEKYTP